MQAPTRSLWFCIAWLCAALAHAGEALPRDVAATLAASGLPLKSFGFHVRAIDAEATPALATLNAEHPFMLASTAKLVTSLAALDLLGPTHHWHTAAYATGPVVNGRLDGDLVIVGGSAGLTPAELGRWFKQMRAEGLAEVSGHIVLRGLALLHEEPTMPTAMPVADRSLEEPPNPRTYNQGALVVAVHPTAGARAGVTLSPQPPGVVVLNEVFMGGGCAAWAQWRNADKHGGAQVWVRGSWDASCGRRDIAFVRPPPSMRLASSARSPVRTVAASTARIVTALWAEAGGTLRGRVIETGRPPPRRAGAMLQKAWASEVSTPLPEMIREMNKTSNNLAARSLLLSLSPGEGAPRGALLHAQERVYAWLRAQGLADGDIHLAQGSGQSREERGKPRAMVQLLLNAWRANSSKAFVDSLPIAGVDGTLAHRMRTGSATGQAFLKTGTLSDARALAGYVRAKSGKVYAVAAIVNHPQAARATPALDAAIEWVVDNG